MDKLLQTINGFSGDDMNLLKQLQTELKKQQDVIVKALPQVDAILGSLDPARHALGYLHVLAAKASSNFEPELFLKQTTRFIKECQAKQVRLEPKKFRVVCQKFTDVCRETKQPLRAIKTLKTSIWKIGGDAIQITPQHSMFVQCCILAKNYKAAKSVLEKFVFEIDPDATAIESVHTRLYFYYGGIAYIGLKEFAKALEFFEIVISAPAFVASAIMAEAYKKYVLVSLIHRGELAQLPRYTNPQLVRLFKQISAPYDDFATSFSTRSVNDLHKAAENNVEIFVKDGNMGLVKQAIQALTRQNIKRLTKTYLTLSTTNIADQVGLPNAAETERKVFKMIQDGQVYATINQKDGMVEFLESPDQFNDNKTLEYLDSQLQNAIQLTRHVNQIDDQIGLDQKYIQKILQAERGQGAGGPTGGRWPGGPAGGFGLDDDDLGMAIDSSQSGPGGFRG